MQGDKVEKAEPRDVAMAPAGGRQPGWWSPLAVAIAAAAVAALGNAVVALVNSRSQIALEEQKAEQARILEMIKTGDRASARENLRFLLDAGLISAQRAAPLRHYLDSPESSGSNRGPVLPASGGRDVQRPTGTVPVDLYYCEGLPDSETQARSALGLRPPGYAEWRVRPLSAQQNQNPAYQVNQYEIRYNPDEAALADELRTLFSQRLGVNFVNRPNTMPTTSLSVFFCEGATGALNATVDASPTMAR